MGKANNRHSSEARQRKKYRILTQETTNIQNNTKKEKNLSYTIYTPVKNDDETINEWSKYAPSRSAIQTLQMDMNEWQEAFNNSGNSDIAFLLEIAQDLLNNRNADEYINIYNRFLAHFPNGIPIVNVYIPGYGYNNDIINKGNDVFKTFVKNPPTQEYLNALSRGEEERPELTSSYPTQICI